ncbi:MAG: pyridoxal phosphate-dependent aminotransferase, partial [Myxococcales bacterium]
MLLKLFRDDVRALPPSDPPVCPPTLARMDANECPLPPPEPLRRALLELAGSARLERYPHPAALPLREAFGRRFGVDPRQVIAGAGSNECVSMLLGALARPGAKVLVPAPSFYMYGVLAKVAGVRVVEVPLTPRFELDADALEAALERERPAAVLFASPNNPTGNRFDPVIVERVCRRGDVAVLVDEAYGDYCRADSLPLLPRHQSLFVLRTLSKAGLAGLRAGFLVGHPEHIALIDRVRQPYNVTALSQALGAVALDRYELLQGVARQ